LSGEVRKVSDIVEFKPKVTRAYDTEYVPITDILNTMILIKDFTITSFDNREVVDILAETLDGNEFATRTSSKIVLRQLKEYEKELKSGKKLKCKIVKRKRYYTLAPPT
jgi:hypothetical protein